MDFPPLVGGIANYYFNLAQRMPSDKIVVLMNKTANCKLSVASCKFRIYYKNFFSKLIWPHWLPLIWHVYKIAKDERIEMLWVGQVLPVGTAVFVVSKLLKIPYYISCHGNDLLRAKSISRKHKLAKKILENAEYITANTQFTKNILINDFSLPAEKIKIIYPVNVLSRDQVNRKKVEELRRKYNLQGKRILLTVARLVKSKGVDNVIKALPRVWQEISDLVYLIVGDGLFSDELLVISGQVDKERKRIIFTGSVPHNELPNYYALADVFILTPRKTGTDTESFGIVYLEAKEFGLPIIAGNTGGVREIKNIIETQQCYISTDTNKFILVNSENILEISNAIKKSLSKKIERD